MSSFSQAILALSILSSAVWAQDACTLSASGGDDSPGFLSAAKSCDNVVIPADTTLNISTKLDMTGLENTYIDLQGTIQFNPDVNYWIQGDNTFFFEFQNSSTFWLLGGQNVTLTGGGTLDGVGDPWYEANESNSTLRRPIILTVYQGDGVTVKDVAMIDSPMWFNLVVESQNVLYDNVTITAHTDGTAHNTDGWDTYRSDRVTIQNSVIVNGDDCVSFKPNSTNILVSNLDCTGSHGVSVGSLGQYPQYYDIVENVTAINIKMAQAQNGARIKAWAGPNVGSGIVRNITFQNWVESEVDNPVVIDQCYFTDAEECEAYPSNTYIEHVWFNNITGTGTKATVADIGCSPDGRCTDVNVNDLNLTYPGGTAKYVCENVELSGNAVDLFPECTFA